MALGTRESLAQILTPLKKDVDEVIARAGSPAILEKYDQETDVARSCGVFGSPSFIADGELFWGDDRLEEAISWAGGKHELQKVPSATLIRSPS